MKQLSKNVNTFITLGLCFVQVVNCQIDPSEAEDCFSGPSAWYRGTHNVTKYGIPCQRWDAEKPHLVTEKPKGGLNHNYCRNPDHDLEGLWCFTTNITIKWQSCGIPKCRDDSLLLYTTRDHRGKNWIAHYPADAEVGFFQPETHGYIYNVTGTSFVWALAADKRGEQVFFTDYKVNHLGVLSMVTNETRFYMQGMCHGIEELAYDFMTGNLYWTDSSQRWLMMADKNFEFLVRLYKNESEEPFGLALHAGKRRLYFSVFQDLTPSLKMADMAGNNMTTLFQSPTIHEIPSLTVDYTDDRLYWISNKNPQTYVFSCDLDGKNLTVILSRPVGRFWGIAAYLDTIFLTDQIGYHTSERGRFYRLWIVSKAGVARQSYKTSTKPKSLSIYSTNEEYIPPYEETPNGCLPNNPCNQLCIPLDRGNYTCRCSLGYETIGEKCVLDHYEDNFLLMIDLAQGRMFQIPFDDDIYSYAALNIPTSFDESVTCTALDSTNRIVYWSNRKETAVYMSDFDGLNARVVRPEVHANTMVVDPATGNIYYADDDSGYLCVMDKTGAYSKVLYKPSDGDLSRNHIEDISLDLKNKRIYWSAVDITNDDDDLNALGVVMRAGFDGSSSEVVFHNMLTPRSIYVDNKNNKLFLASNGNVIYEVPLSSLENVSGIIPSTRNRHTVRGVSREDPIVDFFIRDGHGYMVGRSSSAVIKFSLENPATQRAFGSSDFFLPRYLSWYDSTHQKQYSTPPLECATLQCQQLCLQRPKVGAVCQCGDGYQTSRNRCTEKTSVSDDTPPSYGNSCPRNMEIQYMYCRPAISLPPWNPPVWTDNKTPTAKLRITTPTIENAYRAGTHTFLYTATDESDNVGQCSFTVTIKRSICKLSVPPRSLKLTISSPKCDNGDIVHTIRCRNRRQWVREGAWMNKTTYNLCLPTLQWRITNYTHLSCEYPGATTTPLVAKATASSIATTKPAISTTTITTTTLQSTSLKTSQPPSPTPTNGPTPPPRKTTTTKRPLTTTKTFTDKDVNADKDVNSTYTTQNKDVNADKDVNSTYTTQRVGNLQRVVAPAAISTGVIVVIVLVVLVVIAVVATAVVCIKKRNMIPPSVTRMMWSRSSDQGLTHSSNEDYHKF